LGPLTRLVLVSPPTVTVPGTPWAAFFTHVVLASSWSIVYTNSSSYTLPGSLHFSSRYSRYDPTVSSPAITSPSATISKTRRISNFRLLRLSRSIVFCAVLPRSPWLRRPRTSALS